MKKTDYCSTCHCEGVRKHDCCNLEKIIGNPTKQTGLPRSLSFARNGSKAGFTLAETLITLTILGVVAAITVPMLINKQMEAANRTKLKKAMAAYEKALNQMIIDNDIKSSIGTTLNGNNCEKTSPYFKPIKTATGNNCRFKTADKVWWDITDIEHPLISLKDEITDDNIATLKGNADSLDDDKTSFIMVGEIKDGIVRINDLSSTSDDELTELTKLYKYAFGTAEISQGEGAKQKTYYEKIYDLLQNSSLSACSNTAEDCHADSTLCKNCYADNEAGTAKIFFGDQGKIVAKYSYNNSQLEIIPENGGISTILPKVEFYENGKIKKITKNYGYTVYIEAFKMDAVTSTNVYYNYDEDGNMTGCTVQKSSAPAEACDCSPEIYQCPKE